jgi:3-oxo-Delta1-steroid hydratase/dehydrogenase medium subunit
MKPAPFDYYAPDTIEEAVGLLAKLEGEDLDAKILAGGQSLMPMLSLRVARPDALVDLRKISALDYIREEGDTIAIGAMTSKSSAEDSDVIRTRQPLFREATRLVGHRQIRNRSTVGGSFAHAEPTAEYGAAAMVLGMEMKVVGPDGERTIPAKDFYVTFLTTAIDTTEILTEVRVPALKAGTGWSFQEMARREGDHAVAGAAVTLRLDGGVCKDVSIAVFGVNANPTRLADAEAFITGKAPTEDNAREAGRLGADSLEEPMSDVHGTPQYRRGLIATFVARCLVEAASRAS